VISAYRKIASVEIKPCALKRLDASVYHFSFLELEIAEACGLFALARVVLDASLYNLVFREVNDT
jgi:hypothetical protein